MEVQLNRQTGSEPNIAEVPNLALHDLKALERKSVPSLFTNASTLENISTADSKGNSTGDSSPSGSQDTEDILRQTLALYNTMNNPEDLMHVSFVGPTERHTKFSTMKTVPLDMENLKEDLSYYQYKLYQKFSIKMTDLVRLETLGKGAFGEVTRVFNKTDRKFYALKEIKKQSFKKPIYFESAVWTEIQNLLKVTELNDTSLLRTVLIDFDEDEETCYMLMELGGGTLEEYADCMRAYGFEWKEEELEYILHHLASQIQKIKKIGMVHRDIKPSNVIISCKEDSFKLGDLGCACITVDGVQKLDIAGTPHYMSPEVIQAVMRREAVVEHDPYLSDLFSLGITMLTLLEPNLKRNIVGKIMETVVKVKYPGLYPILADLLGSPGKREEGMQKILAKTPKLQSYKDFAAGNVGDKYRLYLYYKIITKNKNIDTSFYFDMFILDDALLVINKKIYILTKDKKPEEQNLEEVTWRIRRARCYYMQLNYDAALKELTEIMQRKELKSFDTPNVMTKAKALLWLGIVKTKLGRIDEALDHILHCLGIRVAEHGEVHEDVSAVFWQLGVTYLQQENCAGSSKAFKKCVEIGEKLDPKERKYMAKSLNYIAMFAEWRGEHEKALELFERAKDVAVETHGEHHPAVADQYLGIAYENILLGRNDEGVELYERALAIKKRWYGENNPEVADAYTKMARGYERLGDYNKAQELVSHSISIWKNVSGEDSQELAEVYQFVGTVLCKKGHYMKSLDYTNKVMNIKEKHLGEDNPRMASTYIWHAEICSALSLESDKQKSLQKLLAIDFDHLIHNVDNARIGFRTARLLAEEGKTEKAWDYLQKGYQMCIFLAVAKTSKTYACYCEAVARIRYAEGKYELALEGVKEALSIRGLHPCHDPDIAAGLFSLMGDIYEALDNYNEALKWRRECESAIKQHLSKGGLTLLKALTDLARVLEKVGDTEEAQSKLKDAKCLVETVGIARCHPITHVCIDLESTLAGRQKPNGK